MINETLPALQRLKADGLVRHIGITGLPLKIYKYVLDRYATCTLPSLQFPGVQFLLPPVTRLSSLLCVIKCMLAGTAARHDQARYCIGTCPLYVSLQL